MQGIQNLLPKWVVSRWVYGWGNDRICDMCNTCCHSSNNMTCHVQMPVINESHKHIYIYIHPEKAQRVCLAAGWHLIAWKYENTAQKCTYLKHDYSLISWVHWNCSHCRWMNLLKTYLFPSTCFHPNTDRPSLVDPDPRTLKFQRNIRAKHLLIRHANPSGPTSETHLTLKDDCARTWRSSNAPGNQTNERDLCFWTWDENFMEQPAVFDDRLGNQWKPTQKENTQKKRLKESHQESASWSIHEVLPPNFLNT